MPLGQYNEPPRLDAEEAANVAGNLAGERARSQMQLENIFPTENLGKGDISDLPNAMPEPEDMEEGEEGETAPTAAEVKTVEKEAKERERAAAPVRAKIQVVEKQLSPIEKAIKNLERQRMLLRAKEYAVDQWLDTFRFLRLLWQAALAASITLILALIAIPAAVLASIFLIALSLAGVMIVIYQSFPLTKCFIRKKAIDALSAKIAMQKDLKTPLELTKRQLYRELNQLLALPQ